jgi:hypothetical protein
MRRLLSQTRLAWLASAFALAAGLAVAWMDTRPLWDDAGITAGCVFLASALAAGAGAMPWLVILLTAGPLVAVEIGGGSGVLIAAVVAAFGAAVGWSLRRVMVR